LLPFQQQNALTVIAVGHPDNGNQDQDCPYNPAANLYGARILDYPPHDCHSDRALAVLVLRSRCQAVEHLLRVDHLKG
jgi:hypothetical protein